MEFVSYYCCYGSSTGEPEDALFTRDELGLEETAQYVDTEARFRSIAAERSIVGDSSAEGRALLSVAWAVEKQGRGIEALEYAANAQALLRASNDLRLLAECCHSMGVWRFHHFDADPPVAEFSEAIELRSSVGDIMGTAQSWHNLGYVQLISGQATDALASYGRAANILTQAQRSEDRELALTAFRQFGFVLSHQAYAAGRHSPLGVVLDSTKKYFEHVAVSGAHREPVLAYLAPGIALAASGSGASVHTHLLDELVGISPDAESWLRAAVHEAGAAMITRTDTGTGRRAYLGSHLLALSELARWCYASGRHDEAASLLSRAHDLASARGWRGEASRIQRIRVDTGNRP